MEQIDSDNVLKKELLKGIKLHGNEIANECKRRTVVLSFSPIGEVCKKIPAIKFVRYVLGFCLHYEFQWQKVDCNGPEEATQIDRDDG